MRFESCCRGKVNKVAWATLWASCHFGRIEKNAGHMGWWGSIFRIGTWMQVNLSLRRHSCP